MYENDENFKYRLSVLCELFIEMLDGNIGRERGGGENVDMISLYDSNTRNDRFFSCVMSLCD